jgi:hypothetical protein
MLTNSKIFLLSKESEILSESTEPLSDSITIKDSSTLTSFITAPGPYSPPTKRVPFKKLKEVTVAVTSCLLLSLANITLLRSKKHLFFKTLENGLPPMPAQTTSSLLT